MVKINNEIEIDDEELIEKFSRSSGPGGQHVNKVSTKVELRFNLEKTKSLSYFVKERLKKKSRGKINKSGEIVIKVDKYSSQFKNRELAKKKLKHLILDVIKVEKVRLKTKPSFKVKEKRMKNKINRSNIKELRKKIGF